MDIKLADNLRKLQKDSGFSQKEFATKLGIKDTTFSAYVRGKIVPPLSVIMQICEFTGVDMLWLCGIDENNASKELNLGDILRAFYIFYENADLSISPMVEFEVNSKDNGREFSFKIKEDTGKDISRSLFDMLSSFSKNVKIDGQLDDQQRQALKESLWLQYCCLTLGGSKTDK